jgi:hypothetical protein
MLMIHIGTSSGYMFASGLRIRLLQVGRVFVAYRCLHASK